MPKSVALSPASPWVELSSTDADWKQADPALLGTMLSQLHLIRAFEETVLELAGAKAWCMVRRIRASVRKEAR